MKDWLKVKIKDGVTIDRALWGIVLLAIAILLFIVMLRSLPAPSMPVYHAGIPNTMILDVEPASGENLDARGMLPELPDARENRWLLEAQGLDACGCPIKDKGLSTENDHSSAGNERDGGTIDKDH